MSLSKRLEAVASGFKTWLLPTINSLNLLKTSRNLTIFWLLCGLNSKSPWFHSRDNHLQCGKSSNHKISLMNSKMIVNLFSFMQKDGEMFNSLITVSSNNARYICEIHSWFQYSRSQTCTSWFYGNIHKQLPSKIGSLN